MSDNPGVVARRVLSGTKELKTKKDEQVIKRVARKGSHKIL